MFKGFILEIFSIVISILLALAVDRWRQKRHRMRITKELAESILKELKTNLNEVKKLTPVHENTLNHLSDLPEGTNVSSIAMNIELPDILSSAWEVTKSTQGLTYMPLSLVTQLSKTYYVQNFLQRLEEKVFDIVFTQHTISRLSMKKIVTNILSLEKQLLLKYYEIIPLLETFVSGNQLKG